MNENQVNSILTIRVTKILILKKNEKKEKLIN